MNITITARHFKAPDKLKEFAANETQRLSRFFDNIIDVDIILNYIKPHKSKQEAELQIKVYGQVLKVSAVSEDMYKSIDIAIKKAERQLKKYKGRLRSFTHEKAVKHMVTSEFLEEE